MMKSSALTEAEAKKMLAATQVTTTSLVSATAVDYDHQLVAAEAPGRSRDGLATSKAHERVKMARTVAGSKMAAGKTITTTNNGTTTGLDAATAVDPISEVNRFTGTGTRWQVLNLVQEQQTAAANKATLLPTRFGDRPALPARGNNHRGAAVSRRGATGRIKRAGGYFRALQQGRQQHSRRSKKGKTQLFLWVLLGISIAMGWLRRVAEAAFAPRSRADLTPSSGTGGVFGCVGACSTIKSTRRISRSVATPLQMVLWHRRLREREQPRPKRPGLRDVRCHWLVGRERSGKSG